MPRLSTRRVLDVTVAMIGGLICAPIMLVIAVLIRLADNGPVIYCQTRIGYGRQPFTIYKFRTMALSVPITTCDGLRDSCITTVGRWLRPLGIDELPQFVNLLKGDMTLVGPRPHSLQTYQAHANNADYLRRYCVPAGLFSLACVNLPCGHTPLSELPFSEIGQD